MPAPERTAQLVSAGGVVYRHQNGRLEVALCGRSGPRTWNLPKGTPDPGESIAQTALREVCEETGLEVDIEEPLGCIEYRFSQPGRPVRYHKRVHFFLMRATGGSTDAHDPEFDDVQWFTAGDALRSLSFPNEMSVVQRALDALAARRADHEPGGP